jgi:hypothetical protein
LVTYLTTAHEQSLSMVEPSPMLCSDWPTRAMMSTAHHLSIFPTQIGLPLLALLDVSRDMVPFSKAMATRMQVLFRYVPLIPRVSRAELLQFCPAPSVGHSRFGPTCNFVQMIRMNNVAEADSRLPCQKYTYPTSSSISNSKKAGATSFISPTSFLNTSLGHRL